MNWIELNRLWKRQNNARLREQTTLYIVIPKAYKYIFADKPSPHIFHLYICNLIYFTSSTTSTPFTILYKRTEQNATQPPNYRHLQFP